MIPRTPMDDKDAAIRGAHSLARERYAGEHGRIDRGLLLALNGAVLLVGDTLAQARSDRDPEKFYLVRGHTCDCPDFGNAPGGRCKHRWAVYFIRVALATLAMGQAQEGI
jgi:SWIM zinc finger